MDSYGFSCYDLNTCDKVGRQFHKLSSFLVSLSLKGGFYIFTLPGGNVEWY